jgi:hypothetical protein
MALPWWPDQSRRNPTGLARRVSSWEVWNPLRVPGQSRRNSTGSARRVSSREVWNPLRVPGQVGLPLCAALFGALFGLAGCGDKIQETYGIDVVGAADVFAEATEVTLEVAGREVARASVRLGAPIDLVAKDIDPAAIPASVFRVRGFNAEGKVVAIGQTPEIELVKDSPILRVFVQRPGTIARARDTDMPIKDHVAVAVDSVPTRTPPEQSLRMGVAVFGTGRERIPRGDSSAEALSNAIYVYNPLTHFADQVGLTASVSGQQQFRTDAAALARADGRVLVFGGLAHPNASTPTTPTSLLDVFRIRRINLLEFEQETLGVYASEDERAARSATALAAAGPAFAFGGRNKDGDPLDSVVSIDIADGNATPIKVLEITMSSPRVGHTATTVPAEGGPEVLVFGGAAADGAAVAEVFEPPPSARFHTPTGEAGPNRRDHGALLLLPGPDGRERVLVVGGAGADGQPRADSVLYFPRRRNIEAGPITLRTPRRAFTMFSIADDLVILGGYGADGKAVASAEIYHARTLDFVAEVKTAPRARAAAAALPNVSVVVIGGEVAPDAPSAVVEVYQPRRPE